MSSERIWYFDRDGGRLGPFSEAEIYEEIAAGNIYPETLVWNESMADWEEAQAHFDPTKNAPSVPSMPQVDRGPRTTPVTSQPGAEDGLYAGAPARSFREAIEVCIAKYADFSGRASRSEFWFFVLFNLALGFVASFLDSVLFGPAGISVLSLIVTLGLLIPGWAVGVRRLHDTNRSGLIYVGLIVLSSFFMIYVYRVMGPIIAELQASGIGETPQPLTPEQVAMVQEMMGSAPLILPLGLVVFCYGIFVLVLWCLKGTPGPNRFG